MSHNSLSPSRPSLCSLLPLAATLAGLVMPAAGQASPGRYDIGLVIPDFALWAVDLNRNGVFDLSQQWGLPGDTFLAGQPLRAWHDQHDEMIVVRNGTWYVKINDQRPGYSGRFVQAPFVGGGVPVVLDVNGDGFDDAVSYTRVRVPGSITPIYTGTLWIDINGDLTWNQYVDRRVLWNFALNAGDRLLGGKLSRYQPWEELAIFRNATGHWDLFVNDRGTPTANVFARPQFGLPGDLPMLADMNGDGVDDLVVFRPSMNWVFINYWEANAPLGGYGPDGDVDQTINYNLAVTTMNTGLRMPGRLWNLGAVALRVD